MTSRAILATHRQLFLLLVGLGLLARVLVPAGWMPHVSDGGVRLVLCGSYGPAAAQAPVHHGSTATAAHGGHDQPAPAPHERQSETSAPCPFTLASASALLLGGVGAIAVPPVAVESPLIPVLVTRTRRLAAPPPPAIGPPTA